MRVFGERFQISGLQVEDHAAGLRRVRILCDSLSIDFDPGEMRKGGRVILGTLDDKAERLLGTLDPETVVPFHKAVQCLFNRFFIGNRECIGYAEILATLVVFRIHAVIQFLIIVRIVAADLFSVHRHRPDIAQNAPFIFSHRKYAVFRILQRYIDAVRILAFHIRLCNSIPLRVGAFLATDIVRGVFRHGHFWDCLPKRRNRKAELDLVDEGQPLRVHRQRLMDFDIIPGGAVFVIPVFQFVFSSILRDRIIDDRALLREQRRPPFHRDRRRVFRLAGCVKGDRQFRRFADLKLEGHAGNAGTLVI